MQERKLTHALDPSFDHSPAFLTALGRLVAEAAMLEAQMDLFIGHLASRDQRSGQSVTAELDFRRKVNLLMALIHHHFEDEQFRDRAVAQVNSYHAMYNERNDYVHGMWVASTKNQERGLIRVSARGAYKFSVSDVPLAKIENLANKFNAEAVALMELLVKYMLS